jgi:hypothetical protein
MVVFCAECGRRCLQSEARPAWVTVWFDAGWSERVEAWFCEEHESSAEDEKDSEEA